MQDKLSYKSDYTISIFLLTILPYFSGDYVLVWQKGDQVLTAQSMMVFPDRRFKLLPDHTLELRNINPRDGGDYSCKISVLGDPIEITHTLEILRKSINPQYSQSSLLLGGVVSFHAWKNQLRFYKNPIR